MRSNQLIGYGLVVGLDGSGDQTTQTPFTVQSMINMLAQLGITCRRARNLQLKNVAAVMVTAPLPPFAQPGQTIDVTVSSMGNAKSLRGGTLLMTPLKGADGQIYAMAQGNMLVGGAGRVGRRQHSVQINHLSAGRIPGGATVERARADAARAGRLRQARTEHDRFHAPRAASSTPSTGSFGAGTASGRRRPRDPRAGAGRRRRARRLLWRSSRTST